MGSPRKMTKFLAAALATSALAMPITANAADLFVEPPIIEAPVIEARSGWYLRGDVTYDFQEIRGGYAYTNEATHFKDIDSDDAFDVGVGVGYQVNDNFRVDATVDYVFEADLKGSFACVDGGVVGVTAGTVGCGTDEMTDEKATFTSTKVMANAYYDIAHIGKFTPYVGAGIGGAYVKYKGYNQHGAFDVIETTPGTFISTSPVHQDLDGDWRFAYALHAGASVDLTQNLKLDLGYSYQRIEGGEVAGYDITSANKLPQIYDEGFDNHVLKAGLRYNFW